MYVCVSRVDKIDSYLSFLYSYFRTRVSMKIIFPSLFFHSLSFDLPSFFLCSSHTIGGSRTCILTMQSIPRLTFASSRRPENIIISRHVLELSREKDRASFRLRYYVAVPLIRCVNIHKSYLFIFFHIIHWSNCEQGIELLATLRNLFFYFDLFHKNFSFLHSVDFYIIT